MTASKHESPPAGSPTLARCVGDVDDFAATSWGRRPAVHRSATTFDDLLSVEQIGDLLEGAARRPLFRMVRQGAPIPPSAYTKTVRLGGVWTGDVADVDAIARQFAAGATLVLQSLERFHPPLRRFTDELRHEISHPVQANAYLTPSNSAGLAPHRDLHDVLALQVDGTKSWTVDGLGTIDVRPGDVLYIPRGCEHSASTSHGHSLHITVGITPVTGADVARRALAGEGSALAAPLPIGFARATLQDLESNMKAVLATATDVLAHSDPGRLAQLEQRRAGRGTGRGDALRTELQVTAITDDTVISQRVDAAVRTVDGTTTIHLHDREIRMPAIAGAAIDAILTQQTLAVRDLAGLNETSRLVLARRLVREGMLEIRPQPSTLEPQFDRKGSTGHRSPDSTY